MGKQISTKKFVSNIALSVAAQIVSVLVSFVMGLIVPKFIDEFSYAYWQLYILYAGYVGVLHFGLLDGIVLRYGAYDYDELDKKRIRSQFTCLLLTTALIGVIVASVSLGVMQGERSIVFVLVAVSIVLKNITTYNSYIFQITNRISRYVIITIAQRLAYGIAVVVLLVCGVKEFYWYCLADILGDCVGISIGIALNRGSVYLGRMISLRETFRELCANLSAGIILMLANWSSILLIGSARMIIEWRWGELTFGKVSFAFSLTNIFLTFVTAVSVVLFPSLKRIEGDRLPQMYKNIRELISPLLFFALMLYFPGSWIVRLWLPNYAVSLDYLAILLPIIIFSSKVSLLTNNYLKVYRKEKSMLLVNLFSVALGVAVFSFCAYGLGHLNAMLVSVVLVIMLNSVLSETVVMRTIKVRIVKEFFYEAALTAGFILIAHYLDLLWGFLAYLGLFLIYCVLNFRTIGALFRRLLRRRAKSANAAQTDVDAAKNAPASLGEGAAQDQAPSGHGQGADTDGAASAEKGETSCADENKPCADDERQTAEEKTLCENGECKTASGNAPCADGECKTAEEKTSCIGEECGAEGERSAPAEGIPPTKTKGEKHGTEG